MWAQTLSGGEGLPFRHYKILRNPLNPDVSPPRTKIIKEIKFQKTKK